MSSVPDSTMDEITPPERGDLTSEPGGILDGEDGWMVAGRRFHSRLIVGTGKYRDLEETAAAIQASGAEMVTVAVRRVNLSDAGAPMLQDYVDPKIYTYLPNTAGCHTADDAVRTLRLAREAGGWNLVKLEVLGPPPHLYPDMRATFEAAEALLKDGFEVMVYCADDPVAAKRLEDMGCVAVMPLGAPIGSGLGLQNPAMIAMMIEQSEIPLIVDAGVGTASDAAIAMARAMGRAVEAGRLAHLAGRMPRRMGADPSSPLTGLIR
jgi:thiazole synthase